MSLFRLCSFLLVLVVVNISIVLGSWNVISDGTALPMASELSFDINNDVPFAKDTPILVYGSSDIILAMDALGMTNYEVRYGSENSVTVEDLQNYPILVVGWNENSDMSGLLPAVLEAGLTGRVVLSGHDADYHTAYQIGSVPGAAYFMTQSMKYVLDGVGTGMVALGDAFRGFDWVPASWGIETTHELGRDDITSITDIGYSSGIFNNLEPNDMANWSESYHVKFDSMGAGFEVLELGQLDAETGDYDVVTVANDINRYLKFTMEAESSSCLNADNSVTYTICYENSSEITYNNVFIVDMLPSELLCYQGDFTFDYMSMDRCYVNLGTIYPDELGCFELEAVVTGYAEPGSSFTNTANMVLMPTSEYDSNATHWVNIRTVHDTTDICCPEDNPAIIYISETATGGDSGIDWSNAYSGRDGLQKAFNRINNSACTGYDYVLYVGAGTYYPGDSSSDTFALLENMQMYGGFPAKGCDFDDRDTKKYKPILTGQVDNDAYIDINTVVTMGNNTFLDGFIVENANRYCVYGENADFVLKNCEIRDSERHGVYASSTDFVDNDGDGVNDYGNVTIKSCKINDNSQDGVHHEGIGSKLDIYNSWVMRSGENGIYTIDSNIVAKNNIISESNMKVQACQGIRIEYPTNTPIIYGNTISNNRGEGLYFTDVETANDPNDYPDIQNCILFYNNSNSNQLSGVNPEYVASYCFIQNCSNQALHIYDEDPMFACPKDPNGAPSISNYHLAYNSVCKDIGNASLFSSSDLDYDNENRIFGSGVDIGADEVYSCDGDVSQDDISNQLDWNDDGIVNLREFKYISEAWLSHDPNDPVWANDPNYADDIAAQVWHNCCNIDKAGDSQYQIDISDLEMFLYDAPWLWEACWYGKSLEDVEVTTETLETMSLMSTSLTSSNTMISVARTTSTIMYVEEEPEADPYEGMSNAELAVGIRDVTELLRAIETQYYYGCEDKEDLLDLMDFLDDELTVLYEHIEE